MSKEEMLNCQQIPAGLESNARQHLNKGKVYISRSSPRSVLDAYSLQFQNDFSLFIKSRSEELVPGGRMVLSFMGRGSISLSYLIHQFQDFLVDCGPSVSRTKLLKHMGCSA